MNVTTATTAELIAFYNQHAPTPVKKFQDRKTAEARVTKQLQFLADTQNLADETEQVTEAKQPTDDFARVTEAEHAEHRGETLPFDVKKIHLPAQEFLQNLGDTKKIEAVRLVLAKFPELTRIQLKHTAASVGINKLTARNGYDTVMGVK